jgi:hypothetical protein
MLVLSLLWPLVSGDTASDGSISQPISHVKE